MRSFVIIHQDTLRGAIRIVELAIAQRPEKGRKPNQAQPQRQRYQKKQSVHRAALAKRKELAMTSSELIDMAMAATNGVTMPAIASGTASIL